MMRRYRKGEIFRPPTAAESAASADAMEGFRRRAPQPPDRQVSRRAYFGKLDADLEYDDTTGVSVSIWQGVPIADTGMNIPGVLPPPMLTSGQLDEDGWVKIEWITGHWYVTGAEC